MLEGCPVVSYTPQIIFVLGQSRGRLAVSVLVVRKALSALLLLTIRVILTRLLKDDWWRFHLFIHRVSYLF